MIALLAVGGATLGSLAGGPAAHADLGSPQFTWTQTGLSARYAGALAYDGANNDFVLFGGSEGSAQVGDTWTGDGSTWMPQTPAHSPSPGYGPAMAYDAANGDVVLFGGWGGGACSISDLCGDTWTWDGTDWTQQAPEHSPPAREAASMVYDTLSGKVVLFGGRGDGQFFADTWTWDGQDWNHETPANSPDPRAGAAAGYDAAAGATVLFGGIGVPTGGDNATRFDDTWTWNGSNWNHETPTNTPPARNGAAMAYDGTAVVLFGGCGGSSYSAVDLFNGCDAGAALGDTWTWNGSDWSPQTPANTPSARNAAMAAYDPLHQDVMLFGGFDYAAASPLMGDWWTWDGSDWTEQSPGTNPAARMQASMVFDEARQEEVLFGGYNAGHFGDTWTRDPAVWTQQSPQDSPSKREAAAMAYDSARQETVLFGGVSDSVTQCPGPGFCDDTWVWNGFSWTKKDPVHVPEGRQEAAMAYDADAGRAILFGGQSVACDGGFCDDTWTWNGSDWRHKNPDRSPPALFAESMAYDPLTSTVVLFGGSDGGTPVDNTWTWDGSDWRKEDPPQVPPARAGASMAFDPLTGDVVLFGGADPNGGYLDDTWAWDGSNWKELFPPDSPPARFMAALAFDDNGNGLLFGGYEYDPGPDGGSWLYAPKPSVVAAVGTQGGMIETPNTVSPSDPLGTVVNVGQTDSGGTVSVAQTQTTHHAPAGYAFLDAQATIVAPRSSPTDPLTLVFALDPSLIAGDPGAAISVFRTESGTPQLLSACASTNPATPDPCLVSQDTAVSGAIELTVKTTSASIWNFALPGVARSLSIGYSKKKGSFNGKLSSTEDACVAHQKATVFRKKKGRDDKIGTGKTSSSGAYAVRDANPKGGKYYASVGQHEEPGLGICEAAKSKSVRP